MAGTTGHESNWEAGTRREPLERFLPAWFRDREVFLRGGGSVGYLQLGRRRQLLGFGLALGLVAWLGGATFGVVYLAVGKHAAEREAETQRVAFLELLSDVGAYHHEFSRIVGDLEGNQSVLLSRLAEANGQGAQAGGGIQAQLKDTQTDQARILIAREALLARMESFEGDLRQLAARDANQKTQLAETMMTLEQARAEGAQVARARERLDQELRRVEGALAETMADNADLELELASVQEALDESRAEGVATAAAQAHLEQEMGRLSQAFAKVEGERSALQSDFEDVRLALNQSRLNNETMSVENHDLQAEIRSLHGQLTAAGERTAGLRSEVAQLEENLDRSNDRAQSMLAQRDFQQTRSTKLEARLDEVSEIHNKVLERLAQRTMTGIGMIERVVAMTGLNVNELIHGVEAEAPAVAQGGPYIARDYLDIGGDFLIADDPQLEFRSNVALLDQQMSRWEALQEVVRTIPLSSPLDHYRVTSGFGERTDPVNGRKAMHYGIDMKAPFRTPVMATAPGTVVFAGWNGHYGRFIEIDHGNGIRSRYGHLNKVLVKRGDQVAHREEIGLLGSSGRSTGAHLHYEILVNGDPYDPGRFVMAGRNAFKE